MYHLMIESSQRFYRLYKTRSGEVKMFYSITDVRKWAFKKLGKTKWIIVNSEDFTG